MGDIQVLLSFVNCSEADGDRFADSFVEAVRDIDKSIGLERRRQKSDTQDFGASLAVVLGTAAARSLAKGIAAWLARNSGADLEISCRGAVVLRANHLDSKDIPRIVAALKECE